MKLFNNLVRFGIPVAALVVISACGVPKINVIPKAVNTVAPVSFNDLNLKSGDYTLVNTATAEATVVAKYKKDKKKHEVTVSSEDFSITYNIVDGGWYFKECDGVARLGYLTNMISDANALLFPEDIARRLAIYRLINEVKTEGADGIIEPIVSTNVQKTDSNTVTYTSTAEGKLIKLKSNK